MGLHEDLALMDEIEAAEQRLANLRLQLRTASCAATGCDWVSYGGCNACCDLGGDCCCSVPVYQCSKCGEFDYGHNDEARCVREECAETR